MDLEPRCELINKYQGLGDWHSKFHPVTRDVHDFHHTFREKRGDFKDQKRRGKINYASAMQMKDYLGKFTKNNMPEPIKKARYPWVMVRSVHYYPNDKFDYSEKFNDLYFG